MIWNILKIKETKDKNEITKAYRMQLMQVNPEEKPEEFKRLRSAYEEAMKLADTEEEPETEKTPVDLWIDKLDEIYISMDKRRDVSCWKELLSQDICISLDTRADIEEAMLTYFLANYKIPQNVWRYLDSEFSFIERADELFEKYPEEFVKYVILDGINYENVIMYELFPEGSDGRECDEYISSFLELRRTPFAEADELAERLEAFSVCHPYGDVLLGRYHISKGDTSYLERIEAIYEIYPEDNYIRSELLNAYYMTGNYDKAVEYAAPVLEENTDDIPALQATAYSLAALGKYEEAMEHLNKLIYLAADNPGRCYELDEIRKEWSTKLIERYEEEFAENPSNGKNTYDLIWTYLQLNNEDKAFEILPSLTEDYPNPEKYNYLVFLLNSIKGTPEAAIEAAERFMENAVIPQGNDEEAVKSRTRISDLLARKGKILYDLGKIEEGRASIDEALAVDPDNIDVISYSISFYFEQKAYPEALEIAEKLIANSPGTYRGHVFAAIANFEMYRDNEAFREINTALEIDGSDLFAYLLKLRILVRNGAFEPADDLIAFLKENGVTEDVTVMWCEAQMLEKREHRYRESYDAYVEIEKKIESLEEKPSWLPEFYFMMTNVLALHKDRQREYGRDDLLAIIEKGLKEDPEDFDCLEYKGWLLKKENRIEESLEIYHNLEKRPRNNLYIESQLAELYYEDPVNNADKSRHYYNLIGEDERDPRLYHLNVAYLNLVTKDFDECRKHLELAWEADPEDSWILFRFAQVALIEDKLQDALDYSVRALEMHRKDIEAGEVSPRVLYWDQLAQVYRRMGLPEKAVEIYTQCAQEDAAYKDFGFDLYDTYFCSGMFDELKSHFAEWKKDKNDRERYLGKEALYYVLTGQTVKADVSVVRNRNKMNKDDMGLVKALLAASLGKFDELVKFRKEKLDKAILTNKKNTLYEYSGYAFALWLNEQYEDAENFAKFARDEFAKYIGQYELSVPVYVGSYAVAEAILGEFEMARKTLDKMKRSPKCDFCKFPECKDVFSYSAKVELIEGNIAEALELVKKNKAEDPSEEVAYIVEAYLRKRGIV